MGEHGWDLSLWVGRKGCMTQELLLYELLHCVVSQDSVLCEMKLFNNTSLASGWRTEQGVLLTKSAPPQIHPSACTAEDHTHSFRVKP